MKLNKLKLFCKTLSKEYFCITVKKKSLVFIVYSAAVPWSTYEIMIGCLNEHCEIFLCKPNAIQ